MKTTVILIVIAFLVGWHYCGANAKTLIELANKMETESSNELYHTTMVYMKIKKEEIALANLKNTVRSKLRSKNSQFWANTLCGAESADAKQRLGSLADLYLEHYEPQLIEDILHDALKEAVGCKAFDEIVDIVWNLYHDGNTNLYELLVRSQIQLYYILKKQRDVNDNVMMRKLAYSLYKTKEHKLFNVLKDPLKETLNELITKFPTNLQYLLFYGHFCLMNSKYSEYAYTAMTARNLDLTSRYIWVWFDKWSIDDTGHIKANVFEKVSGNTTELTVQLLGLKYHVYYFMKPDTKLVAAWDMSSEPVNSFWNIEFIDNDRVAFYQQGHIMCSTEEKSDAERRLLRAYTVGTYSSESSECQWLLGSCKRN